MLTKPLTKNREFLGCCWDESVITIRGGSSFSQSDLEAGNSKNVGVGKLFLMPSVAPALAVLGSGTPVGR